MHTDLVARRTKNAALDLFINLNAENGGIYIIVVRGSTCAYDVGCLRKCWDLCLYHE